MTSNGSSKEKTAGDFSVVICTYADDRWDALVEAIHSVKRQTRPARELILVVDHNEALLRRAEGAFPDAKVVANEYERGLSGARNTGLRQSTCDVVVFLDDDAVAEERWLARLAAAYTDASVIGTGGSVRPDWCLEEPKWLPQEFYWTVGCTYRGLPTVQADVRNPVGANASFRRTAFSVAGEFNAGLGRVGRIPLGCEETEFAIRLQQRLPESRILYIPDAAVNHRVPADRTTWRYFLSRCWAEGLSKAVVTSAVGQRDGLESERLYTRRTLPAGVIRGLGEAATGDVHGVQRAGAILAGLAATVFGYVRGRLEFWLGPRSQAARQAVFRPAKTGLLDLDLPASDWVVEPASAHVAGADALLLARLHGDPLRFVTIARRDSPISAPELASAVWAQARSAIAAHVERHDCMKDESLEEEALLKGLPRSNRNCDTVEGESLPFVAVIVPTVRRHRQLRRCLECLTRQNYPSFEVIVVDNDPSAQATRLTVEALAAEDTRVRYIAEARPGSSVARNRGASETSAEILAFTDDDILAEENWLRSLVQPFVEDPQVGAVTGLMLPYEVSTPAQRWFEEYHGSFLQPLDRRVYDLSPGVTRDRLLYPYWTGGMGGGARMAVRRDVYFELGGLDPALGAGSRALAGGDIGFLGQLLRAGHPIVYEPRAICWHDHQRDETELKHQVYSYGVGATAILTKCALNEPGFRVALLRTIWGSRRLITWRGSGERTREVGRIRSQAALAAQNSALGRQIFGYLAGPILYLRSRYWARRLGLYDVISEER